MRGIGDLVLGFRATGMPAPTTNKIVRASALVMAIGVNALFVGLLVSHRARVAPEPLAAAMMWIVLEQSRAPQQRPVRDRTPGVPAKRMDPALIVVPPTPDATIQSVTPPPRAAEDGATQPLLDWDNESRQVAKRFAQNYGKPDTPSGAPNTDLPAKLCAPRVPGEALQAKMDELLPPPPEPYDGGGWPPAGSVLLAGNVRVQMLQFGVPVGGRPSERGARPEHKEERPRSSVPDPDNCD